MRGHAVALLVSALVLASCGGDGGAGGNSSTRSNGSTKSNGGTTAAEAFRIDSLPIDLSADVWAWPANVDQWPASQFPPIHLFGKDYMGKVESTLTFDMVKVGATVLSPITGRVVDVRPQPETCDVELYIGSETAQQVLSLDHVVATVNKGDDVVAGQAVATVPAWQCKESFGRFELMMVRDVGGVVQAFCPIDYLSDAMASRAKADITKVMTTWNSHAAGAKSAYSDQELANGVCATPTAPAN